MNRNIKQGGNWSAVWSLFAGVTCLIAAEFVPVSLLTPIASDLGISEGMTGQTVTAVGILAVITSLSLAPLTASIDRRKILLSLSALLVVSCTMVGLAQSYPALIIARALLGVCVGGFWSMASAVVLQLVPTRQIPRALSIVYAGVSVATILSLPLASYLGYLWGWRAVFFGTALLSAFSFLWQYLTLPSLKPVAGNSFGNMARLLKTRWFAVGMLATICSYGGYHIVFTYLRPYLEYGLKLSESQLSLILLVFGLANCMGTFFAGVIIGRHYRTTMYLIHLVLAVVAFLLFLAGANQQAGMILIVFWGVVFGFIPVGWSAWITRTLADWAEIAGGLSVAAIQLAIGLAAACGGLIFDVQGMSGILISATTIQMCALTLVIASFGFYKVKMGKKV